MLFKKLILVGFISLFFSSSLYAADCGPNGQSIRILASDFPAIHALANSAESNSGG